MRDNPFKPTFGTMPFVLVGRDDIVADFDYTFEENAPGLPGLSVLITGARGMGKTVMLNTYRERAEAQGWVSVQETGRRGLVQRLAETSLPSLLLRHDPEGHSKLTSLGFTIPAVGGMNASWQATHDVKRTLRSQVEYLCDVLERHDTGLVITVDEATAGVTEDMQELGELVQFARGNDRRLAIGACGLSNYMDEFLSQPGTTFLRRAERYELRNIEDAEAVKQAFVTTVTENGAMIHDEVAGVAADESRGYPFLIQRIGYDAWRLAPESTREITTDIVVSAASGARRRLGDTVHAPALTGLSTVDKTYLLAMALDGEGPSGTGQIAERMGVTPQYANTYRLRLIERDLIEEAGYGKVRFTLPYLGEALRLQGESNAMADIQLPLPTALAQPAAAPAIESSLSAAESPDSGTRDR